MKERIRLLCRTLRQGSSAVTAIVTGCRGATPRSPGALLVLTAETALGTVGGGQAEHDIIGPAMEMLRGGAPVQQGWHQCLSAQELRHMGQEFGGEEEILLLRWEPRDLPLAEALLSAMGQNADCSLRLEYDKVHWRGTLLPIAEAHTAPGCFTLKLQEGGRCYVFGGGHVSQALVPLLSGVDFCCVVLDERPDYATPALFPTAEARCGPLPALAAAIPFTTGDSVIIMTRGHQGDYEVLCEALRSPVWYIGMVGSHRKMEATFRRLREDGFTDADLSRIVTPIGLAIDAETPAEIAVSITAQLIQRRAAVKQLNKQSGYFPILNLCRRPGRAPAGQAALRRLRRPSAAGSGCAGAPCGRPSPYPQLSKEEHTMIKITPDFPCIHCGACAKACSHGVIKMVPNEEGKLIPRVSFSSCRYCRACRWACPVIPREEV